MIIFTIFILSYRERGYLNWTSEAFASKLALRERCRDAAQNGPIEYSIYEHNTYFDISHLELLVYLEQVNLKIKNFPPIRHRDDKTFLKL